MKKRSKQLVCWVLGFASLLLVGLLAIGHRYISEQLPDIAELKDTPLQVPLRIYSKDKQLVGEFGEKRRIPLNFEQIPQSLIDAVIATEDARFYQHAGVDYRGILRASLRLISTGKITEGASTITMQVARNYFTRFLSRERTFTRKLKEALLAYKIEQELSKKEILALYFNVIFMGKRAYGVGAAAEVYYGKKVKQLNLAQIAMLAGIPKAPSDINPINNPGRALKRRAKVLERMLHHGYINPSQHESARNRPITAEYHGLKVALNAPYVAEMVRKSMTEKYGNDTYIKGFQVFTTIDSQAQIAANIALRKALIDYDTRHGYRGPEQSLGLLSDDNIEIWEQVLHQTPTVGGLKAAIITSVTEKSAKAALSEEEIIEIPWSGLVWARKFVDDNARERRITRAQDVVQEGDLIRVTKDEKNRWRLAQIPLVNGALVALNPYDGSIQALIGGFDFNRSKLNRVAQARRQPGSNFKPFIYSAALEKGFTAATIINDAPIKFDDANSETSWRPKNYGGKFHGPTRMRVGLYRSINQISIRILREIGIKYAINFAAKFGFNPNDLPRNLTLALGTASLTPLSVVSGYASFANGGYRIDSYLIDYINDHKGRQIFAANPATVCQECTDEDDGNTEGLIAESDSAEDEIAKDESAKDERPTNIAKRILSKQNAYIMNDMLRDVIRRGSGRKARSLGRSDLAGKTGTTNDSRNAWFTGFNGDIVATSWIGFDNNRPLGKYEEGAKTALPMWMSFMGQMLKGKPARQMDQPDGLVSIRIDKDTGLPALPGASNAIFEIFRPEYAPKSLDGQQSTHTVKVTETEQEIPEDLFD